MLTIEEKQAVVAHVQQRLIGDALRVLVLNVLPVAFVLATQIKAIWFYLEWFLIGTFVVASFGISVSRVSIPLLPLCERIPTDILTLRRGVSLLTIQALVIATTFLFVS